MKTIANLSNHIECVKYIFDLELDVINKELLINDLKAEVALQKHLNDALQLLQLNSTLYR